MFLDSTEAWRLLSLCTASVVAFLLAVHFTKLKAKVPLFYSWIGAIAIFGGALAFLLPIALNSGFGKDDDGRILRQLILYTTGGVLGVITLGESHRKNNQEKEKNENDHTRQVYAERRSRYTKAVEYLADEKAGVRLGGIYTLVGLVDEWLTDDSLKPYEQRKEGQVIINNLCAYIRSPFSLAGKREVLEKDHTPDDYDGDFTADRVQLREEQDVRRTIFEEISKRSSDVSIDKSKKVTVTPGIWSTFEFDFSRAPIFYPLNNFTIEQGNFVSTRFYGEADFRDTKFTGATDFRDAKFTGDSSFKDASFNGDINFNHTIFSQDTEFSNATFTKSPNFRNSTFIQETKFIESIFNKGADFYRATFKKNIIFHRAKFYGEDTKQHANFYLAIFDDECYADFYDAFFKQQADFRGAQFKQGANFKDAKFRQGAEFIKAIFSEEDSDFSNAIFGGDVDFTEATFNQNVSFESAKFFKNVNFWQAFFKNYQPTFAQGNFKSYFSFHIDWQDYEFIVCASSQSIPLGSAQLNNVTHRIPMGTVLFDPDSWDERFKKYTQISKPAR